MNKANVAKKLRRSTLGVALGSVMALAGCHSAFVQVTINNHSGGVLHIFELDYPSASFGSSELAAGAAFHYRFKVVGNGVVKLTWTGADERDHVSSGPELSEGEEGRLAIEVGPTTATWIPELHVAK